MCEKVPKTFGLIEQIPDVCVFVVVVVVVVADRLTEQVGVRESSQDFWTQIRSNRSLLFIIIQNIKMNFFL